MLLSICIETRGQPEFLNRALQVLQADAGESRGEVEIVVLSGANAVSSAPQYEPSTPSARLPVRVVRAPAGGGSFHPFAAADQCAGSYVWFLSEGSLPLEGALSGLLPFLRGGVYSVVLAQHAAASAVTVSSSDTGLVRRLSYRDLIERCGFFAFSESPSSHVVSRKVLSAGEWTAFADRAQSDAHVAYLLARLRSHKPDCILISQPLLVTPIGRPATELPGRLRELGSPDAIVGFARLLEWLEESGAFSPSDFLLTREHDGSSQFLLYRQLIASLCGQLRGVLERRQATGFISARDLACLRGRYSAASARTVSLLDELEEIVRLYTIGWPDEAEPAGYPNVMSSLIDALTPDRKRELLNHLREDLCRELTRIEAAASPDIVVLKGRTFGGLAIIQTAEDFFAVAPVADAEIEPSDLPAGTERSPRRQAVSLELLREKLSAEYGDTSRNNNGDLIELPGFNARFYTGSSGAYDLSDADALEHYRAVGWRSGLSPAAEFNSKAYLTRYPDVAEAGVEPLQHFVQHGIFEGRIGWA